MVSRSGLVARIRQLARELVHQTLETPIETNGGYAVHYQTGVKAA